MDEFNRLYGRRAYMHYYFNAGIEQDEFNEALEDMYSLIKDFEVTTWDYNNFDIGEEEEEEEEEEDAWYQPLNETYQISFPINVFKSILKNN